VSQTAEQVALGIHADEAGLLKAFPGAVELCDLDGHILLISNAFTDLAGKQPEGTLGKRIAELFAPEFRPAIDEAMAEVAAERKIKDVRAACLTSHGAPIPVSLSFSLLERAEEGAEFVVVSVRDLTKEQQLAEELNRTQSESESLLAELDEAYQRLKKAQDDLVRRERLAVSSEMAASVAHEIRNPLAIIMMSIQYLHSKLSPGHALREFTSVIVNKVKQLDEITTQLIDYGRPRELKFEARDLHQNLNQALCLANSKCVAQGIKIIKRYHRGPSKVTCDHGLMDEVFSNLLMNAIQSMPKGGVLTVETEYDQRNNQTTIRIADTGCGIPKNVQAQLPKPFFTTKRGGTGLGLAISQRIIDHHQGSLSFTSMTQGPKRGTTFTIKIPITRPKENRSSG
jgi:two-component system sensor histidine kinase AtoS